MSTDIDTAMIEEYLRNAHLHSGKSEWGEGYWVGRAVQHATQNAVDYEWLFEQLTAHGLDAAVIAVPKGEESDPRNN